MIFAVAVVWTQDPRPMFPEFTCTKNYATHTKWEFNPTSKQEKMAYRIGRQFFCSNSRGQTNKAKLHAYTLTLYYTDEYTQQLNPYHANVENRVSS
jgi:hypothetical protein